MDLTCLRFSSFLSALLPILFACSMSMSSCSITDSWIFLLGPQNSRLAVFWLRSLNKSTSHRCIVEAGCITSDMVHTTATFRLFPPDCSHSRGIWRARTLYRDDFNDWSVIARDILATINTWSHFMRYVCVARTLARLVSCRPRIFCELFCIKRLRNMHRTR
jgi:hypothetical protein